MSFRGDFRGRAAVLVTAMLFGAPALAQWSADPSANLVISDVTTGVLSPFIAATSDGGFYVSWHEPLGIRLQRLDANGHALWTPGGIRVNDQRQDPFWDRQQSPLAIDAAGNVHLALVDCCAGDRRAVVYKIGPDGSAVWAPRGIVLPTPNVAYGTPLVTIASDDAIVAAWDDGSNARVQKFDAGGVAQWGVDGVLIGAPAHVEGLRPAEDGGAIVLWRVPTDPPSSFKDVLVAQKFAGDSGAAVWNDGTPVRVFGQSGTSGVSAFVADGRGGGVFWADGVNTGEPFSGPYLPRVQHLDGDGRPLFGAEGVAATTSNAPSRGSAAAAFDPSGGDVYLIWPEAAPAGDARGSNSGVFVQRIDAAGNRAWGEAGRMLVASTGSFDPQQAVPEVGALPLPGGGFLASWLTGEYFVADHTITVARLDSDGNDVWPDRRVDIRKNGLAAELAGAISANGFAAYVWANSDLKSSPSWINAQNIGFDGRLGIPGSSVDPIFANGFDRP